MADIAGLGEPDGQTYPEEAEAFAKAIESIVPVLICTADFPLDTPVPVLDGRTSTDRHVAHEAPR